MSEETDSLIIENPAKVKDNLGATGMKRLSEGQRNILLAKIIDQLNEDVSRIEIHTYIKEYYKEHARYDIKNPYAIVLEAKALWLKNVNLPSLENYKKEQYVKTELLEDELRFNSQKDIVEKANPLIKLWTYKDGIAGLNSDSAGNNINIGISLDRKEIIKALELGDD